jgi:hypothetical protein
MKKSKHHLISLFSGTNDTFYRARIKSIYLQYQQAIVFFADFSNKSTVIFSDIYSYSEYVRTFS